MRGGHKGLALCLCVSEPFHILADYRKSDVKSMSSQSLRILADLCGSIAPCGFQLNLEDQFASVFSFSESLRIQADFQINGYSLVCERI